MPPIFDNPHWVYQFFAAQRQTDLILQIRAEPGWRSNGKVTPAARTVAQNHKSE